MNISHRHHILEKLGISQYYGRYSFPFAVGSPNLLLEDSGCGVVKDFAAELIAEIAPEKNIAAIRFESSAFGLMQDSSLLVSDNELDEVELGAYVNKDFLDYDFPVNLVKLKAGDVYVVYDVSENQNGTSSANLFLKNVFDVFSNNPSDSELKFEVFSIPVFDTISLFADQGLYTKSLIKRWIESDDSRDASCFLYIGQHVAFFKELLNESRMSSRVIVFENVLNEVMSSSLKKKDFWRFLVGHGFLSD